MSNSIQRDQQRRFLFAKLEKKRVQYKCTIRDISLPVKYRRQCMLSLNRINRNSSSCRIRNRCVLTGRGRGVYQFSRISRIKLRELASQGLLSGVCKSTW